MKITIIGDALDRQYAGVRSYLRDWVEALDQYDHSNEYFLVHPEPSGGFKSVKEIKLPWRRIPGYRAYRYGFEIPKLAIRLGSDVVVEMAHFGPFNLPNHIKRFSFIHDLSPLLFPEWHPFMSQQVQKVLLPRIIRKADLLLTNSHFTQSEIARVFPHAEDKVLALRPGCAPHFRPKQNAVPLKKYGIQKPFLLYLGTLEPRKNLGLLLRAFEKLKSETDCPHQLVLAGKVGWKVAKLQHDITASPWAEHILCPGYIDQEDLPALYSQAAAFVYPSKYEGFGLPVLEAMACGSPVLVADNSSLTEVAGIAGLSFDPEDEASLRKQMLRLVNEKDLREALVAKSIKQAATFDWKASIEAFKLKLKG